MKKSNPVILFVFILFIIGGFIISDMSEYETPAIGIVALLSFIFGKYYLFIPQENLNSIKKAIKESSISSEDLSKKTGIPANKIDLLLVNPTYTNSEIESLADELSVPIKKRSLLKIFVYVLVIAVLAFLIYFLFLMPV